MNTAADEITLSLHVRIEAEGGRYRSSCPAIEVASVGRTIDEALTNIHEAVEQRLEDWIEEGDLLDRLARRGVTFVAGRHPELATQADIPPGVLAATLNPFVRLN